MWKVTLRNIFRYKSRVFMMILGVGGCTALMIAGFGMRDSIQNVVDYQYEQVSLYDYDVTFSSALDEDGKEEFRNRVLTYADDVLFAHQESADMRIGKTEKQAFLSVLYEPGRAGKFISFHNGSRELSYPSNGEALVNNAFADSLGVRIGDEITVSADGKDGTFRIAGIFDNYVYNYVYITAESYEEAFGKVPDIKLAFVVEANESDITADLLNEDGVINVTSGRVMRDRIGGIMKNLIYVVILTIVCAAALAFIVIYDLTNINIHERMREIATVKVLGFYPGESAIYVLRENILLTVIGAAVGIPLGIALTRFIIDTIKIELISFTARVLPGSFVISVLLTFVFSLLVDIVMAIKLNRIDMAGALKAAE